ncbi:MAG: hypothetical protein FJ271_14280 [Planctomycetes bacterium]|nr:hypothetical protein [Planctomycetota bacterium]
MASPPAAPFIPNMQIPQALPSTAPSSAPQFMPPPPTPLNGQTAYNDGYNPWALMHAGYYPGYSAGYYPPVTPASYAPGYAPSNVPGYWYGH